MSEQERGLILPERGIEIVGFKPRYGIRLVQNGRVKTRTVYIGPDVGMPIPLTPRNIKTIDYLTEPARTDDKHLDTPPDLICIAQETYPWVDALETYKTGEGKALIDGVRRRVIVEPYGHELHFIDGRIVTPDTFAQNHSSLFEFPRILTYVREHGWDEFILTRTSGIILRQPNHHILNLPLRRNA